MPLKVPEFLIRRIYVKGSLARANDGFEFQLKNTLGSGYAKRMLPLSLNGSEIPLEQCGFQIEGESKVHGFEEVTPETPFSLRMNRTSTIHVRDVGVPDGAVKLRMGFEVQGIGDLSFEVTDTAK